MKKNILLVLALLCNFSAWAAHNHEPSYNPSTITIDKTHDKIEVCPNNKSDLTATNSGNYYDWYKYNSSTNLYTYSTSTGGQTLSNVGKGKYLCAITKETACETQNTLTACNYNLVCLQTEHPNIGGDNYF